MAKILVAFGDSWPWGSELETLTSPSALSELDTSSKEKLQAVINDFPPRKSYNDHVRLAEFVQHTFRYPTLVSQALGCDQIINLTGYGTSLNHLFLYLAEFEEIRKKSPDNQYIFLVTLTSANRDLYFDPMTGEPREIIPWAGGPDSHLGTYYKHFHHQQTELVNWAKNVMLFQMYCKLHSILDFYFQGFSYHYTEPKYENLVDFSRIYGNAKKSFMDVFANREGTHWTTGDQQKFYQPECAKYFQPCQFHPNILGHEVIANEIITFMRTLNPEIFTA